MHTGDSKEIVSHAYKSYIYIGLEADTVQCSSPLND